MRVCPGDYRGQEGHLREGPASRDKIARPTRAIQSACTTHQYERALAKQ